MKRLSETLKEMGIAFTFPIEIKNEVGNETYYENSNGFWWKREYDSAGNQTYYETYDSTGNQTYYETSNGYWRKRAYDQLGKVTYYEDSDGLWFKSEYDSAGNQTYYENSKGSLTGTPRATNTCEGKVVEVDGVRYELKTINN